MESRRYDVIVIGTRPGGDGSSIGAVKVGKQVAVIDKSEKEKVSKKSDGKKNPNAVISIRQYLMEAEFSEQIKEALQNPEWPPS